MSRDDQPEVGIGFTVACPMTEAAARHAGEVWLAQWGDELEQTGVTVSYFDAHLVERQLRVEDGVDPFEQALQRIAAVGSLRMAYVERQILEGSNRVEVPNDHGGATVYEAPSRWREPRRRFKLWRRRWLHRHPDAPEKLWRALRYMGAAWGSIR
jgi:hypothetical protein